MDTWEILERKQGVFEFNLKLQSGNVLLKSEQFTSKDEIHQVISDIKKNVHKGDCFERKTNHQGKFQFALKNPNGKTIGHSTPYDSEAGMENGIKNLQKSILGNLR